ncbi:beta-catenin-interacting protein 1 isoform X1 [Odocoileus virginianus]|uniref:Beta-catenin-interacting protein 1 isoform X1 n=1 Tax=Odocoileus virginianus TaxID=9874 RepID=A0ABM4IRC1_ODOVR
MNREGASGKSPEEMYIQQKVRVLLMLRKMGSNLTASEEEFLRTYAGVVNSQLSQLPQHSIDQECSPGTLILQPLRLGSSKELMAIPSADSLFPPGMAGAIFVPAAQHRGPRSLQASPQDRTGKQCGGRSDGVFQVGDGGPEAVAATPVEHPGSWPRPGDLCGPHR